MAKKTETMEWAQKGDLGFQRHKELDAIRQLRKEKSVPRFRLKAGEEAVIVFLDDTGFFIKEHNLKIGGVWGNYFTCVSDFAPCPICERGEKPSYIGYFSIIDTREFVRKDGEKVKNRKVLFPAKGIMLDLLFELKKNKGSFVGVPIKVKRFRSDDVNCGAHLEVVGKKINLIAKFGADTITPIEYEKVLAPPTEEELQSIGIGASIVGASETEENIDIF